MLTDKIRPAGPEHTDPEDYFGDSLGVIFPDDITNQHGEPDGAVIYMSPRLGDIKLYLADPKGDSNRLLFSHFLWNSGIQLAEFIEGEGAWDVKGKTVLEVGAGSGIAGIVAAKAGAESVIITDYPALEILANLEKNVKENLPEESRIGREGRPAACSVQGHEWGELSEDDDFVQAHRASFDIILVADCLWMPDQHSNLMKSISWFLKPSGKAWVVAGFHTGRFKISRFFDAESLAAQGLEVESIVERDPVGNEREWVTDRGIEDKTKSKRWLVVSVLRRS
jgi:predicted nicotinamide N-methyase